MWKYLGKGEFLPGVPARDLTDEEAKEHPEVKDSPLYEHEKNHSDSKKGGGD